MKIKEYSEKQAKYDPIAWSKWNICHQKYPSDEIVQHICRAVEMEESPKVTLDIQCLRRGGGAALTSMIN